MSAPVRSALAPGNGSATITVDSLSRETHRVYANGMTVSRLFDPNGRETEAGTYGRSGVALAVFTNAYDANSNRTTVRELDGARVTYGYDAAYQLTNEQRSGLYAYNTTYVYDPAGNRSEKIDSGAVTGYQYNLADELTLLTPPSGAPTTSAYDGSGNLIRENTGGSLTT